MPPAFRSRRPRRRRGPASTSSRSATATRSPRATITSSTSTGRRRSPSRTAARSRSWPSRIIAGSETRATSTRASGRAAGTRSRASPSSAGTFSPDSSPAIRELAVFVAPNVNSYKRFYGGVNWAGNTITWAHDNRTTGFRVVGHGSSFRVEARIPGADCNPYLAYAAMLAAGLDGIERELPLPPPYEGNAYAAEQAERFPPTLREAISALEAGYAGACRLRRRRRRPLPELRPRRAAPVRPGRHGLRARAGCSSVADREGAVDRQIAPFGNHLPVRIRFGEGAIATRLPDALEAEGASRPFVVVDDFMQGVPAVASRARTASRRPVATPSPRASRRSGTSRTRRAGSQPPALTP